MQFKRFLTILLLAMTVTFIACESSTEPGEEQPDTGTITGTITFDGAWPATGDVQISIYGDLSAPFVPTGPPEQASEPIASGSSTYEYTFEGLAKSTYAAIYVSWRDPANPAGTKLLGMYWTDASSSGISTMTGLPVQPPTSVTIDDNTLEITDLNITADLTLAQ